MGTLSAPNRLITVIFVLIALVISTGPFVHGEDAAPGTLKGSIVDAYEHTPITRAYILVHRIGAEDKRVFVDEHGRFSVELQPGFYDVFVSSLGFDPACQKVQIDPGKTAVYKVQLKMSKLENMPD